MGRDGFKEWTAELISGEAKSRRTNRNLIKAEEVSQIPFRKFEEVLEGGAGPELQVEKKGDFVEAIRYRCSCGKQARIVLEYEPGASGKFKRLVPGEKTH